MPANSQEIAPDIVVAVLAQGGLSLEEDAMDEDGERGYDDFACGCRRDDATLSMSRLCPTHVEALIERVLEEKSVEPRLDLGADYACGCPPAAVALPVRLCAHHLRALLETTVQDTLRRVVATPWPGRMTDTGRRRDSWPWSD